jgi:2-aminoadipate transaminase
MSFDFSALVPAGSPAPAVKWTGLSKYHFIGGNNDPAEVPVAGLKAAADAVLTREGRNLATYNLTTGPQGYRPLRDFLVGKLRRDAGIACTADDILIVSGSLQALDLVHGALLERGDTVICERDCYEGTLNRYTRLGVNVVGIPLDHGGLRMDALETALADLRPRACGRSSSTPSRPCRTRPPRSWTKGGGQNCWRSPSNTACRSSRTTVTPT